MTTKIQKSILNVLKTFSYHHIDTDKARERNAIVREKMK